MQLKLNVVQGEAVLLSGSLMSSQSTAANLGCLWTWGCKFFILWLVSFSFGFFFLPVWFQGEMRISQVGTCRGLQSFPLLLVFGCCVILPRKNSCVFSTADDFFFFFFTVFLKTVIYSFYLFTFPLLFFDDENKWTCQMGHKNGMKCVSKSLIVLCILL